MDYPPYSCDLQQVPIELQESLIDLRSDDVVKSSFPEQYYNILLCNVADQYPALWARNDTVFSKIVPRGEGFLSRCWTSHKEQE